MRLNWSIQLTEMLRNCFEKVQAPNNSFSSEQSILDSLSLKAESPRVIEMKTYINEDVVLTSQTIYKIKNDGLYYGAETYNYNFVNKSLAKRMQQLKPQSLRVIFIKLILIK